MLRLFLRQCNSPGSAHEQHRPPWFTKQQAFANLLRTVQTADANITVLFDGVELPPFLQAQCGGNVVWVSDGGSETKSFTFLMRFVLAQCFQDSDIIYFVEDDYVHRPCWPAVLADGLKVIGADYFTLYDHPDKYGNVYPGLVSQVMVANLAHWRTTPSTTNTYACYFGTLKRDAEVHLRFSDVSKPFSDDHQKFVELWRRGRSLVSSIPAYSTHCVNQWLSPVINWERCLTGEPDGPPCQ